MNPINRTAARIDDPQRNGLIQRAEDDSETAKTNTINRFSLNVMIPFSTNLHVACAYKVMKQQIMDTAQTHLAQLDAIERPAVIST